MKRLLTILFLTISLTTSAETLPREDVESAFLYHFINYTEWNDDLPDYYVCIPDDNVLRESAVVSLRGKVINNRKVVVVESAKNCHILVSNAAAYSPDTLTVGSLDKGAMLEFRFIDNKVKFAVNLRRIKESKLKISSQLLKLAILENGF